MVQAFTLALLLLAPKPITWTVRYESPKIVNSVAVAGSFNSWNSSSHQLKSEDGKIWSMPLSIAPGRYTYKFVINGSEWILDPKNKRSENDGNGNINSVLVVTPPEYSIESKRGDGKITATVVGHETTPASLNYDRGKIHLILTVRPNDVDSVSVLVDKKPYPLSLSASDEIVERWSGYIPWDRKGTLAYGFAIKDGSKTFYYGPDGVTSKLARPFSMKPRSFQPFKVPSWVEKSVIYQIFPDRFASAKTHKGVSPWDTEPRWDTRLGGDIAGVLSKTTYLKDLGVGAIYFNPVFLSPSIHRYEATDYRRVDPLFGTNDEFIAMVKSLDRNGIKTVVDLAFNHTATNFFAFDDILKNGEKSAYKDWYFIHSYPVKVQGNPNYDAWFGFSSMPKLNCKNPEVKKYLLDSIEYWHKAAPIAGWRLDVPNEVDSSLWRAFRPLVKSLNPEAWIVGEIWGNGSPWLQGDQFDSVMNYPFRDAVVRFIAEGSIKPSEFMHRLEIILAMYPPQVNRNLMNLISSHDVPRILTLCGGNRELAKLAAAIQFTWVGTPSIYYGDEVGMEGGRDPQNRRGMRWDLAVDGNDILNYYKKLIKLRNMSPALHSGDARILHCSDDDRFLCYSRTEGKDAVIVALNRSDKEMAKRISIPSDTRSLFADRCLNILTGLDMPCSAKTISVRLLPLEAAVLVPSNRRYKEAYSTK